MRSRSREDVAAWTLPHLVSSWYAVPSLTCPGDFGCFGGAAVLGPFTRFAALPKEKSHVSRCKAHGTTTTLHQEIQTSSAVQTKLFTRNWTARYGLGHAFCPELALKPAFPSVKSCTVKWYPFAGLTHHHHHTRSTGSEGYRPHHILTFELHRLADVIIKKRATRLT